MNPLASALLAEAVQAGREARYLDAAELFRKCLAADPGNTDAKVGLGIMLLKARCVTEAYEAFNAAMQEQLDVQVVLGIVQVLIDEIQWHMADVLLSRILKRAPDLVPALLSRAELLELQGDGGGAKEIYLTILRKRPSDIAAVSRFIGIADWSEGRAVIEAALQHAPLASPQRVQLFALLASRAEHAGRAAQGKSTEAIGTVSDLRPRDAMPELLAYQAEAKALADGQGDFAPAWEHLAAAEYALGHTNEAEAAFKRLREQGAVDVAGIVDLAPRFYEALEAIPGDVVAAALPPIDWIAQPAVVDRPTYFLAADPAYMRDYGQPMIQSIAVNAPASAVHIHLMNASDAEVAQFSDWAKRLHTQPVALTREQVVLSRVAREASLYYHSVRFVRFFQFFERYRVPMTSLDVDGLVNLDFHETAAGLGEFDFALRATAGAFTPWTTFAAGVVSVRPTDRARRYMKLVAAMIAHHHKADTLRWGVDQLALRCCYDYLVAAGDAPTFAPLNGSIVSRHADPAAPIWMQAGKKKRLARLVAATGEIDSADAYVAALRRYTLEDSKASPTS